MIKRHKKRTKLRGSKTHGWGMKKKHSGAGNRGGRGNAGTGKRSDNKKTKILKLYGNNYLGKHGFVKHSKSLTHTTINLYELDTLHGNEINLSEKGYTKLLGAGVINRKLTVTVDTASEKAVEKIQKAGGKVIMKEQSNE